MQTKYQNSVCRRGWLHDFKRISPTKTGFLERCSRCGLQMNFPNNMPNHLQISFHIRNILRANDPLFSREYPEIKV